MNIAIIGTGAYGLSNALMLLKNNNKIKMWTESEEKRDYYNKNRGNLEFLHRLNFLQVMNTYLKMLILYL